MQKLLCFVLIASGFAFAQDEPNKNHFLNTDVFELEIASDPQIAPDGSRIVYVRRSNDIMTDRVDTGDQFDGTRCPEAMSVHGFRR